MNLYVTCSALLVLLYFALSVNVSRVRMRRRKAGDVSEAQLNKAIRAHGNAGEYIPLFVVLFLFFRSATSLWLMGIAVAATISRFSHAAGMLLVPDVTKRHPLRFAGALVTYLCLLGFGIALLVQVGVPGQGV